MALDKEDKSFKALINKEYTSPTRKFYQEVGTDTINMNAREVWTQEPDSTPATAVSDGTAKLYTKFSLTADPTYPTEAYSFVSSSEAQRNFISDKYGSSYEIELYDDSDTRIYKTDDIDWVFDYQTGILNIGEPSQVTSQGYSTPFKITAYQYIGAVLSQSIGSTGIISAEWDGSRDGDASITGSLYVTSTISGSNITGSSVEATSITGSVVSASSFYGDGSGITGVTAEWDGSHVGDASITGSLYVTETISGSAITGSSVEATNITGSIVSASNFYGDGSGITGVTAEWDGSHVGDASITGSLYVTETISGSAITGSSVEATSITGSIVSASNFYGDGSGITGVTAEWDGSHVGNAEITGTLSIKDGNINITENAYFLQGQTVGGSTVGLIGVSAQDQVELGAQGLLNVFRDDVWVSGSDVRVSGTLDATNVTGSIVSASNFYGDATLGTAKVSDLTSGRVVLAGTDGELEDSGNFTFDGTSLTVTGDITASANISASAFYGDGTGITGVTAEWDGSHNGNAEITGSLTVKTGHIDLTSSGGDNYFRGFFGFPRVQEVSSSLSGIDPIADELYTNSGSYNGYAVFIVTGSTPALSGTFASNNKFYFNEDGVWHPSPFYTKD